MKKNTITFLFFGWITLFSFSACSTGQHAQRTRQINYASMSTLADALRAQSGVQIVGSANNIKVTIRGVNTSNSNTGSTFTQGAGNPGPQQRQTTTLKDVEPLFVVDKTIVGNSYRDAARSVNVQDIVDIKILKSYSEVNAYGASGKNGVILITTKLAEKTQTQ